MMEEITYRPLERSECGRIGEIDGSNFIGRVWRMEEGELGLVEINYEDPDFPDTLPVHREALEQTLEGGGWAMGAFDGAGRLAGFCTVNAGLFGSFGYALLDQIFITRPLHRKGIGKELFRMACEAAREMGARRLYICAGSSENTIAFYRSLGCAPAEEVNRELYESDPRDIQLEYKL